MSFLEPKARLRFSYSKEEETDADQIVHRLGRSQGDHFHQYRGRRQERLSSVSGSDPEHTARDRKDGQTAFPAWRTGLLLRGGRLRIRLGPPHRFGGPTPGWGPGA